ncbi:MAG TPA: TadE family protein [Pseudonocardiaceae bacterium]|nr:TadE family protein [Pseudonocardiaceae bacterium]
MAATSRASPNHDPSRDTDGGMVTVEAAVALCAFVTVLAMVLAGVSMVLDQIRCTDAAREAARLVARGEQHRAADAVRQIAPPGATLSVTTNGDAITVFVQDPAANGLLPGVHIHAEAYAIAEPTDPDPTANSGPAAGGATTGPAGGADRGLSSGGHRPVHDRPHEAAGQPRPTEGDRR